MALDIAVSNKSFECVKMLLDVGANVDRCNSIDFYCSQDKTSDEGMDTIRLFLSQRKDFTQNTAGLFHLVQYAVQYGDVDFLQLFLEKGLDVNQVNSNNETLLHVAAVRHRNITMLLEIVSLLLEAGADVNATDIDGKSPLVMAFGKPRFVRLLWDYGAYIDPYNHHLQWLFKRAMGRQEQEMIDLFSPYFND